MLSSITPLGERGRGRPWWPTVAAYVAGSAVGGGALGAGCGGAGALLGLASEPARVTAVAAAALVAAGLHTRGRLPGWRRQVDEQWLTAYRGWVVGAGYGVQLGAAVVTIVPGLATWLALALAVATGSVPAGAAVGLTFGVARALPLLATAGVRDAAGLHALHHRLDRLHRPVRRATAVVEALTVAGLAVAGLTVAGLAVLA